MDFIAFGTFFWTILSVQSTLDLKKGQSEVIEVSTGCPFSFDTGNQGFEYKKPKECAIGNGSLAHLNNVKSVKIDTPFKLIFVEYPDEDAYFGENNKNPTMMKLKSEFMGSQAKYTLVWSNLGYEGPVHFVANVFFNATLFWTISSDVYQIPLTPVKNEEIDEFGNSTKIYVDRSILRSIFRNQSQTENENSTKLQDHNNSS